MIETKVEGSPASVRSAATFLDSTLRSAADQAGEDALHARRAAGRAWEGTAADAYLEVSSKLIAAADEQTRHSSRAGRVFEDYAGRLERFQERMVDRRGRASAGGLIVSGTVIEEPADAIPPADLPPGSTTQEAQRWHAAYTAFEAQKDKVQLYNRLVDDVSDDWRLFRAWIDTELSAYWKTVDQPAISEVLANALSKVPAASVAMGLDLTARQLGDYSTRASSRAAALRDSAAAAVAARRSGNPARRAAGEAVDSTAGRRAAEVLAEDARYAGKFAKRVPVIGYGLAFASDGYSIAHGESPGKVVTSEAAGLAGGAAGAALVVGGAAVLTVGAPVIAVAAGAAVVGVGASLAAEYAWDHWVPDGTKEAIDDGLRDFGNGVKDVASDVGDGVTNAAKDIGSGAKDVAESVGDKLSFWN